MSDEKRRKPGDNTVQAVQMGELEFRRFQKLIFEAAGIQLSTTKRTMVAGRLLKRLRLHGLSDFTSYVRLVDTNPDEYQQVVDLLTTNETYFFREPRHFDFLRDQILMERNEMAEFRVWSAACSSGEEPYSVAMLLADRLGNNGWKLIASDISQQMLTRAQSGHYPLTRTEGIPVEYLKRFCLRGIGAEAGTLLIERSLRRRVEFRQVNLMQSLSALPLCDLILLRNVLIYFDAETKQQVAMRVAQRLKPGGYLFIGHSETLNGTGCELDQVAPAIYRKCL